MANKITKVDYDFDGTRCSKCGLLYAKKSKFCPKCRHKKKSDELLGVIKND